MKILHLVHQYWPYRCGSGTYFQEMSERLAEEGHQVTVFTSNAYDFDYFTMPHYRKIEKSHETYNGVDIVRFPCRHIPRHTKLLKMVYRLSPFHAIRCNTLGGIFLPDLVIRSFFAKGYDLIHAGLVPYGPFLYAGYRIAQRNRIPLVITPFIHVGEPQDSHIKLIHANPSQMCYVKTADVVIAQTNVEKNRMIELGIAPSSVKVLGMGINQEDILGGDADRFKRKHNVRGDLILFMGTKCYDKGANHVIEATKLLWDRGVNVTLALAGPTNRDFASYWKTLPNTIKARCLVFDVLQGQDKKDLFQAMDIFVMPSRNDSFGIVFLESWLCKKPVIGAYAGGLTDVISDGEDGYLVPFGHIYMLSEYIWKLMRNRALRDTLGENGYRKVLSLHTWDKKYAVLKDIYSELIKRKRTF